MSPTATTGNTGTTALGRGPRAPADPGAIDEAGTLRRVDSGTTPDRHPGVTWPDERRPRARRLEGPVGDAADALRRRLSEPAAAPRDERHLGATGPRFDDLADFDTRGTGAPPGRRRRRRDGVEANARLTGMTAVVLFWLLAIEGATILRMGPLLDVHVFVGMLLIPVVLLKIASTTWRFAKYYLGDPEYRRRGPPATILRFIGPIMIVLTVVLFASGVALLLASPAWRTRLLLVHKVSFIAWIVFMTVHVLGHLVDTARLAPRDFYWRTRRQLRGAGARQWAVAGAVALGLVLGAVMLPQVGVWLGAR